MLILNAYGQEGRRLVHVSWAVRIFIHLHHRASVSFPRNKFTPSNQTTPSSEKLLFSTFSSILSICSKRETLLEILAVEEVVLNKN